MATRGFSGIPVTDAMDGIIYEGLLDFWIVVGFVFGSVYQYQLRTRMSH